MLFAAGAAHGQLLPSAPAPALKASKPSPIAGLAPATSFYGRSEGLPPADPQAPDIYRADPKLVVGVQVNPVLGIDATMTNPDYKEGLHYRGAGPRDAAAVPLGKRGYDLSTVARASVPVNDRLSTFGTLGVTASVRKHPDGTTIDTGPAASVGANYRVNSKQTATAEVPLGAMERQRMSGAKDGVGARLKLGF